jgi:hypothetical protein
MLPPRDQLTKHIRSPIRTVRQVNSRFDQKISVLTTPESDPDRSGHQATDAPDRKVHGGSTVTDGGGGDSHEEGSGEHEADGDHDDGQRRIPLHRHGARDRLRGLRHPITRCPPRQHIRLASRSPDPGESRKRRTHHSVGSAARRCGRRLLSLPLRLFGVAAMS